MLQGRSNIPKIVKTGTAQKEKVSPFAGCEHARQFPNAPPLDATAYKGDENIALKKSLADQESDVMTAVPYS